MPPPPILDLSTIDTDCFFSTREDIYRELPQRHEFAQLDGILHADKTAKTLVGLRIIRPDEWWCRGHMPGQPIFPGVLMMECAAQLSAYVQKVLYPEVEGFMAFGAVDGVKFRGSVVPPAKVLLVARELEARPRRFVCEVQAYCNNSMVFEGTITGMPYKA